MTATAAASDDAAPSDEDAFAALVRRHRTALYRYARRRVPAADADDVVAEVFAAAWRHRDRLPEAVELWLYRTAWHALLHQFRGARRREGLVDRIGREPVDDGAPDPGPPGAERLRAALGRLRPSDQELLRLHYWEDLDAAGIAYVVGGSAGAVRVRLHRARHRLAVLLPDLASAPHDAPSPAPLPREEPAR